MALGIGYKIEVIRVRWMKRGFERTASRIGDRTGRKAGVTVGIVRRLEDHICMMQSATVGTRKQLCVDDAGIRIEGNMFGQPIVVDAGNQGTLFWNRGLLLK